MMAHGPDPDTPADTGTTHLLLQEMQLFGHRPYEDEPDPRPLPEPRLAAGAVTLHRDSYVVVMSHHVERDREALRFSLAARPAYIGVLGPRARFQQVAQGLRREENVRDGALARVRSPIGLSLGAETPEEVAVSILAEILAVRHGFDAGFLSGTEGRLHRPLDTRVTARS